MITGKENIINWFKMQNMPIWRISSNTVERKAGNYVVCSDDSNPVMDLSTKRFEEALELLGNGKYIVSVKETKDTAKNHAETYYEHVSTSFSQPNTANIGMLPGVAPSGFITKNEAQEMATSAANNALLNFQYQQALEKISRLERENKELSKEEKETGIDRFVGAIQPFIQPALTHLFPNVAPTTIASVGYAGDVDADQTKRLQNLIERWQTIDSQHFIDVVEKIVTTAENENANYKMYRQMLIGK